MREFGVGRPVPRVEDEQLLRGHGNYTDDAPPAGAVAMHVLRSPHAAARIRRIDLKAARAAPGVLDAFCHSDIAAMGIAPLGSKVPHARAGGAPALTTPYLPLAGPIAPHAGDAVAVVVARTPEQARDAAELIEVDYEELPFVTGAEAALAAGAPTVWPDHPDNRCFEFRLGDAARCDDAFAKADCVVTEKMRISRVATASMEPRAAIGEYDARTGRHVLRCTTQMPHEAGRDVAAVMGLSPQDIRVIAPDIGGAFGMKLALYQEYLLVLIAAKRIGRPVRWFSDRSEAFVSDQQSRDNDATVSLALDAEGRFLGLRVGTLANLGAYVGQWSLHVPTGNLGGLAGVYHIGAFDIAVTGVLTNTVPVGPFRGAGRPEASYMIERIIDRAARETGRDPVELRRMNMVGPNQMPHDTGLVFTLDCGDFPAILDRAVESADVSGFAARRAESERHGMLRGLGLAYAIESAGGPAPRSFDEFVEIRFDSSGKATVFAGTHSHGQGHETIYRQFAAEYLGLGLAEVRVVFGDTDLVAHGRGSFGSRSMMAGGAAFRSAAEKIVARGRSIAAHLLEVGTGEVSFRDGIFSVEGTNKFMTLAEVAQGSFNPFLLGEGMEVGLSATAASFEGRIAFPNACHVCEVEIDPATGATEVVAYQVVEDVGTVVNPLLLKGQVTGGVAQGIGQALCEEVVYDPDSGQLLTGSFLDYAMPRADQIPAVAILDHPVPTRLNPLGAKGAGEAGCVGALPAVMNAVGDALWREGVRHFDMPATPQRVWRALRAARAG